MSLLSLPIHSLQYAEIVVRSTDPDLDLNALSFSVRPTAPPAMSLTSMANVDVKVSTVRDASGTYLSISLGQPDEEGAQNSLPIAYGDRSSSSRSSPSSWSGTRKHLGPFPARLDLTPLSTEPYYKEYKEMFGRHNLPMDCDEGFIGSLNMPPGSWPVNDGNYSDTSASGLPSSGPMGYYHRPSFDEFPSPPSSASSCTHLSDTENTFAYSPEDRMAPGAHSSIHPPKLQRSRSATSYPTSKILPVTRPKRTALKCEYPNCDAHFSRQHDRLRHEVNKHGRKCEWTCDVCRRFFSNASTLERHRCTGTPPSDW
ncbi:uncharacterized protein SCHCODRAFT_02492587 [Schizophyllum commune H4-8]|uniref:C2H2-type domain-containing protein n=1 Tax=Schizophyllum commune (strain H4-8 / FGSC 9210) TaxID=578458 RepID=D8PZL6_SCHCM|nr:uncharacterized protein SCHCODRAFT_02492587 [Schizophyllum commune H4-8]KAI5896428.1 hypothetical protein SCHCODRAFT_02492587 [Schizophyllum commune H4-8]